MTFNLEQHLAYSMARKLSMALWWKGNATKKKDGCYLDIGRRLVTPGTVLLSIRLCY